MGIAPQPVPTTYTLGNCSGYTPVSEVFTFNIEPICTRAGATQLQLMWLNRYGTYDYYTFTAGKDEGINIERQSFKTWNVDWDSDDPSKEEYSRGLTDFEIRMSETHVINSGFINNPDMVFLEEVYTSPEVYEIKEDGGLRPINIISGEYLRKNKGNKSIVNLELSYVYSNNIAIQRT